MKKEKTKTISELMGEIQKIDKTLKAECPKCDGTGKPRTKTGEPPKGGHGNARCSDCHGEGVIGNRLDMMEEHIILIKKDVRRINDNLNAYINRSFTEIRVLPKGHNPSLQGGNSKIKWENGWEDYSGDFYLNDEENKEAVIEKAKNHFYEYFENSAYHRDKHLGLFYSTPRSGRKLIEEMKTEKKKEK